MADRWVEVAKCREGLAENTLSSDRSLPLQANICIITNNVPKKAT